MMREIVFDTETTGFSFDDGDRMVEVGCIEMVNAVETGRTFHAYFHPERKMPAEAQRVNGLSDAFLSDKPLFATQADALLEFLGDAPLVAHNASFDFNFLNGELQRCGRNRIDAARMIDTIVLARTRHPGAKHSLDALCTRYGIDRSHRVLQGALLDAQLLSQVYVALKRDAPGEVEIASDFHWLASSLEEAAGSLLQLRDMLAAAGTRTGYGDMGHNLPSLAISRNQTATLEHGALATIAASAELTSDEPRSAVLALCLVSIKRALKLVKALMKWLVEKANIFVDEAAKAAGKAVGPSIVLVTADLVGLLKPIIEAIQNILLHR